MDSIRMGTAHSSLGRIVAALVLLLAVSAPAWAEQEELADCDSKWEESPASAHCSDETIWRIGASTAGDTGDCIITADCSIDVTVGGESHTYTTRLFKRQLTPDDTASLDLCFEVNSAAVTGYYMSARSSCPTGSTDSSTAQTDGLPAL